MTRVGVMRLVVLPGLLALAGCGDEAHGEPPASGSGGSAAASGGASGTPATGEAGADPTTAGGAEPGATDEPIQVVDVASRDGGVSDAQPLLVLEPDESMLAFDRAGAVADQRFAFDSASLALLTFDPVSGVSSSVLSADCVAAVGFGSELITLELEAEGELVTKTYSASLAPQASSLKLTASMTASHALAAAPEQLFALWSSGEEVQGRLFTPDGFVGDAFDFGPQSCRDDKCASWALWTGQRFLALWSRTDSQGQSVVSIATVDPLGSIVSSRNLLQAESHYRLVSAAPLPSGRTAILLTEGAPAVAPVLVFVDEFGAPEPTLYRYLGATEAWGLVSHGEELALVARSERAQAVFRALDASGTPRSRWVVLDDSAPNTDFEPRAALFTDEGYAALVRRTDGAAAYLALDEVGQGR